MEKKITAWVARDENGPVFFYSEKPRKLKEIGAWDGKLDGKLLQFPEVKWEDKEPTEIELTIKMCK